MIEDAMKREHTESDDSDDLFTSGNYGVTTKPEIEWRFVYEPDRVPAKGWPQETKGEPRDNIEKRRQTMSCEELEERIKQINEKLTAAGYKDDLSEAEALGGRLYTGPMVCAAARSAACLIFICLVAQFVKYNSLLRGLGGPAWQDEIILGCKGNKCA